MEQATWCEVRQPCVSSRAFNQNYTAVLRLLLLAITTAILSLHTAATEVRTALIPIAAESQVLGAAHRAQIEELLALRDGRDQIEKIDIEDLPGHPQATAAAKAVQTFVLSRVSDPTCVELRTATAAAIVPQTGVRLKVYILEKEQNVKGKDPERILFPEEFQETGVPENVAMGTRFILGDLRFHGNSAVMENPEDSEDLVALIDLLRLREDLIIRIEGHVNGNMGGRYLKKAAKTNPEKVAYENATHLSLARAETIKRCLVAAGIDPERLEVDGRGGRDKRFPNPRNAAEEDANRRIEILVVAEH